MDNNFDALTIATKRLREILGMCEKEIEAKQIDKLDFKLYVEDVWELACESLDAIYAATDTEQEDYGPCIKTDKGFYKVVCGTKNINKDRRENLGKILDATFYADKEEEQ